MHKLVFFFVSSTLLSKPASVSSSALVIAVLGLNSQLSPWADWTVPSEGPAFNKHLGFLSLFSSYTFFFALFPFLDKAGSSSFLRKDILAVNIFYFCLFWVVVVVVES